MIKLVSEELLDLIDSQENLNREVVAIGVRNSVGHAFNPKDGTLWFTDNQVDGMGDETPPGEINKVCRVSELMFGMVTLTMVVVMLELMNIKDKKFQKNMLTTIVKPQIETIAHAADLGYDVLYWKTCFLNSTIMQSLVHNMVHGML